VEVPVPGSRHRAARHWSPWPWLAVAAGTVAVAAAAEQTGHGRSILDGIGAFLLFYAGVFALIGLTAAVAAGLLATDRIVLRPGSRVVTQAVHRGVSLAALAALFVHIVTEVVAHRSAAIDAVVPFLARDRTLYVGLGTVASDLVVLIVVTGFMRARFAGRLAPAWRAVHAVAYLAWPLAVVHGLMAGRTAKPYVDWSYGACLAGVALALGVRVVATVRAREEKLAHPVPDRLSGPAEGLIPGTRVALAPRTAPWSSDLRPAAPRAALPVPASAWAAPGPSGADPLTGPFSAVPRDPAPWASALPPDPLTDPFGTVFRDPATQSSALPPDPLADPLRPEQLSFPDPRTAGPLSYPGSLSYPDPLDAAGDLAAGQDRAPRYWS
jgi:DMSO/TMAO reductase YedYZ heme-binding membrane subunit